MCLFYCCLSQDSGSVFGTASAYLPVWISLENRKELDWKMLYPTDTEFSGIDWNSPAVGCVWKYLFFPVSWRSVFIKTVSAVL